MWPILPDAGRMDLEKAPIDMKDRISPWCFELVPGFCQKTYLFFRDPVLRAKGWLRWLAGPLLLAGLTVSAGAATSLAYIDRIFPTPQQAEYGDFVPFAQGTGASSVTVIIGRESDAIEDVAVDQVESRFRGLPLTRRISVAAHTSDPGDDRRNEGLRVYLARPGNDAHVVDRLPENGFAPPARREAYVIKTLSKDPLTFLIYGSDRRGLLYGTHSLLQMVTVRDGAPAVRELSVRDWPAYHFRASGNDERVPEGNVPRRAVEWFSRIKLNTWAVGQSYHWPEDWRSMPRESMAALRDGMSAARSGKTDILYQIHPFGRADDPEAERSIRIAEAEERERLLRLCLEALQSGASHILLRADDFHDLHPVDLERFGSKAEAHIFIIRFLWDGIREEFPNARLIFCPPYYAAKWLEEDAGRKDYIRRIGEELPSEIGIMWTGPEVVSHEFTGTELRDFEALIQRRPILWDNTVLAERTDFDYPYLYAWYMFQPVPVRLPGNHHRLSGGIRFNYGFDGTYRSKVVNMVLSDYLWNPEAYDPHASLQRAMEMIAGGSRPAQVALAVADELTRVFDLRHSPARVTALEGPIGPDHFKSLLDELREVSPADGLVEEFQEAWWAQAETAAALEVARDRWGGLMEHNLARYRFSDQHVEQVREGAWEIRPEDRVVRVVFPFETQSFPGSHGGLRQRISVPESPTGRYFLNFMADDDYYAEGEPPAAWPGYFFKQVLVDGEVVWEDDVVGMEKPEVLSVEVTEHLAGREEVSLMVRGFDAQGVSNLGVQMTFSDLILTVE